MKTAKVAVLPYDKSWVSAFLQIKKEIESALGNLAIGIEHVGSTSVVGMYAKPCIDIDVIIKDYSVFPDIICALASVGYIHEGDLGIKDREAFCYTDKPHLLNHHLYVCPENSKELHRLVTFRDYLRKNPDAVKEYSAVKQEGAKLYPNDIGGYISFKSDCIAKLYKECGLE